jgi:hypothetical protein
MNDIEQQIKNIKPISSSQECMEVATSIFHFDDPIGKYKVFQAQNFFMNNIFLFNKEEFTTILKNKLFTRKYVQKPAYDILQKCVDEGVIYPFVLNSWFDRQISYTLQKQYVEILDKYDNWEQLNIFNEKLPNMISNQFNNSVNPSNSLIKIIISDSPKKVFKIKSWDDAKIADWIKNNPEKSKDILHHNLSDFKDGNLKFPKSKNQLYQNIIEEHLNETNSTRQNNDKKQFNFPFTFSSYQLDYIEYVNNNYPELFNKQLHRKVVYMDSEVEFNGLQSIILSRDDSLHNLYKAFGNYKELLKEDITTHIGFYAKKTSFFEFCLKKENFKPFVFFNLDDNLNNDEKEMLVAAAFMYFQLKYDDPASYKVETNKLLTQWYPNIMRQCSDEQFKAYKKKLKISPSDKMSKELNSIELSRELKSSLDINSNNRSLKV